MVKKQTKPAPPSIPYPDKTATRRYLAFGVGLILIIIIFFWGWSFRISMAALSLKESKEKAMLGNAQAELEKIFTETGLATAETEKNNPEQDIAAALQKIIADKQNQRSAE